MFELPAAAYGSGRREQTQSAFGGYDHRVGAGDGSIRDAWNMSADSYPLLTTRKQRYQYAALTKANGLYVRDCVVWVDGTALVVDGETVGQVADSRKRICGIQDKLVILPDKVIYDRSEKTLTSMEASWSGAAAFGDGTYAGEPAAANTISAEGADWARWFKEGDAVTIGRADGQTDELLPLGPLIVREIEGSELRFYENSFEALSGQSLDAVTVSRTVPDMDHVFDHQNRLWGCAGNEIYASALGDPTNWNVFDGLSTDSWQLTVGSAGEFTGACSYGGRPMFFKERLIVKIYGDTPQQWQTYETEGLGVEAGSGGSLAVAGGTLFYKSPAGIMAYGGSYPRSAADALGDVHYKNAVAGSDGVKYYVSMEDDDGEWGLFVYDTRYGAWHPEDGAQMLGFGWNGELLALEYRDSAPLDGTVYVIGDVRRIPEGADREEGVSSMVEFADWTDGSTRRKGLGRVTVRLEIEEGTNVLIKVQYDSDGVWHTLKQVGSGRKGTVAIPLRIRRCDHYRLRLEGSSLGGSRWTLHAITRERYVGSDVK